MAIDNETLMMAIGYAKSIAGGSGSTPSASDVSYDNTTSGMTADNVQSAIDEVFTSVSSGKTLVAGAITDKGVPTSASDTFTTMATNIGLIPSGEKYKELARYRWSSSTMYGDTMKITSDKDGTLDIYVLIAGQSARYTDGSGNLQKNGTTVGTGSVIFDGSGASAGGRTTIAHLSIAVETGDVITPSGYDITGQYGFYAWVYSIIGPTEPTEEILDVFVDTNPTFGAMYKSYTAGISGTLSFIYLTRCRNVHVATPVINVGGTSVNPSVRAVQGNQVPAYGTYYYTCAVQKGDSIILDYESQASGMNNNHVDLIMAVIKKTNT